MLLAVFAMLGLFVAMYLWMFKLGVIGSLTCKIDGCEKVNTSRWALFLGQPVALWGVMYYVGVFVLSYAATFERFASDRRIPLALVVLTAWGVLFSAYLTWLELAVIHAICTYCVISAVIVTAMFVLAVIEWRAMRAPRPF